MTGTIEGVTGHAPPGQDPDQLQALYEEVVAGLSSRPRRLPAKLLYDQTGARLFEEITRTRAYYPTRVEIGILEHRLPEVRARVGPAAQVVEFGTGGGRKTGMLLEALDAPASCIPIDISHAQLREFASGLRARFPTVEVLPITADYTRPFVLPDPGAEPAGRVLVFFPGSTIGNFEPSGAERFLTTVRRSAASSDTDAPMLLIGVDLVKAVPILERAYDDPEGVTARFNRNTLRHLNRLFAGDFPIESFEHRAIWNAECSRIEMHLINERQVHVTLQPGLPEMEPFRLTLAPGESIVTEHSYKYRPDGFEALCRRAGWRNLRTWTDADDWFAVMLLEAEQ